MSRVLVASGATLASLFLAAELWRVSGRLDGLEQAPQAEPERVLRLERDLSHSLAVSEASLTLERAERERLERRIEVLTHALGEAAAGVQGLRGRFDSWECSWSQSEPEVIESELAALRRELDQRSRSLSDLAEGAARRATEDGERLAQIQSRLDG